MKKPPSYHRSTSTVGHPICSSGHCHLLENEAKIIEGRIEVYMADVKYYKLTLLSCKRGGRGELYMLTVSLSPSSLSPAPQRKSCSWSDCKYWIWGRDECPKDTFLSRMHVALSQPSTVDLFLSRRARASSKGIFWFSPLKKHAVMAKRSKNYWPRADPEEENISALKLYTRVTKRDAPVTVKAV